MPAPGPLNSICDVPGIGVGQSEDPALLTGVSVIVPERPVICAVDHRGGGIGSRDTVVTMPGSTVETVHAICLSGGSAYGLDAAGGVMHALRSRGRGFAIGREVVPIVPTAIVFDLLTGAPKEWDHPPWWRLGLEAFEAAGTDIRLGNTGAGIGATAGAIKGGTGTASYRADGVTIGALAIVNPAGSVLVPGTRTFWGWMFEEDGELGAQQPPARPDHLHETPATPHAAGANTTLAVVATDAALSREQALRLAIMAQDGLARAIRPVHGPLDGDTVFALSTGAVPFSGTPADLAALGSLAADAVTRAVMRGVFEAETVAGVTAYRDL